MHECARVGGDARHADIVDVAALHWIAAAVGKSIVASASGKASAVGGVPGGLYGGEQLASWRIPAALAAVLSSQTLEQIIAAPGMVVGLILSEDLNTGALDLMRTISLQRSLHGHAYQGRVARFEFDDPNYSVATDPNHVCAQPELRAAWLASLPANNPDKRDAWLASLPANNPDKRDAWLAKLPANDPAQREAYLAKLPANIPAKRQAWVANVTAKLPANIPAKRQAWVANVTKGQARRVTAAPPTTVDNLSESDVELIKQSWNDMDSRREPGSAKGGPQYKEPEENREAWLQMRKVMRVSSDRTQYTSIWHLMDQHAHFGGSCGKSAQRQSRDNNYITQLAANTCKSMSSAGIKMGCSFKTLCFPVVLGSGDTSLHPDGTPCHPDRHPQPPAQGKRKRKRQPDKRKRKRKSKDDV